MQAQRPSTLLAITAPLTVLVLLAAAPGTPLLTGFTAPDDAGDTPIDLSTNDWMLGNTRTGSSSTETHKVEISGGVANVFSEGNSSTGGYIALYKELDAELAEFRLQIKIRSNVDEGDFRLNVLTQKQASPLMYDPYSIYGITFFDEDIAFVENPDLTSTADHVMDTGVWFIIEIENTDTAAELRIWKAADSRPSTALLSTDPLPDMYRVLIEGPDTDEFDFDIDWVKVEDISGTPTTVFDDDF